MQLLAGLQDGRIDKVKATNRVFEIVFEDLQRLAKNLMRRERVDHTLRPTALVNETYLRLIGDTKLTWQNRAQFLGIAARAMRQLLVEHARRRDRMKRGGGWRRVTLHDQIDLKAESGIEILDLEWALTRLNHLDPRLVRVIELRLFAGLKVDEVAEVLDVSLRTVHNDWRVARMWLARELADLSLS